MICKYKNGFIAFSIIVLFPAIISAQGKEISLEEALETAYGNNKTLKVASLEYEAAKMKSKAIPSLPKTTISGLFGQMNTYRFDENLSISQDIPNPSYIKAQRELASKEAELLNSKIDIDKNEIRFSISQSWQEWLYLNEMNKTLKLEDSILTEFLKAANAKFKSGETGILGKSTAEFHKNQLKQQLIQNEMLMRSELLKINMYLGVDESFTPKGSLKKIDLSSDSSISNNPIFAYLKEQNALLNAEYQVTKTERRPDFNVGYFVQSLSGPQEVNNVQKNFNALPQFQGFGLGINVPIFGSKAYKAKLQSIEISKNANEKQIENAGWQLEKQWRQSLNEYLFWDANVRFFETEAIPNADFIINNAGKAYRSGEIEYVEYLQALRNSLDTKKAYLNAINNHNRSVITINYLMGK